MMFGVIFSSLRMCPSVKRGCKPRLRSRCVLSVGAVANRAHQRGLANGGRGPVPRQTHARPSIARDRPSHYGQPRSVHSTPQTHPILDVVVDDEVQFLICEAVVFRKHPIDLVDNRFGVTRRKFVIDDAARSFILRLLSPCVLFQIRHQFIGKRGEAFLEDIIHLREADGEIPNLAQIHVAAIRENDIPPIKKRTV